MAANRTMESLVAGRRQSNHSTRNMRDREVSKLIRIEPSPTLLVPSGFLVCSIEVNEVPDIAGAYRLNPRVSSRGETRRQIAIGRFHGFAVWAARASLARSKLGCVATPIGQVASKTSCWPGARLPLGARNDRCMSMER